MRWKVSLGSVFTATVACVVMSSVLVLRSTPAARAESAKPARIGYLSGGTSAGVASGGTAEHIVKAWRETLGEMGYAEGRNLAIESRFAEGDVERLPALAGELIRKGIDVIVAIGPAPLKAARAATSSVPIVAIDLETDPVAAGLVSSLARPGGNVTGLFLDQPELAGKWLELLRDAVPNVSRAGAVWDSTTPRDQLQAIEKAARSLGVRLQPLSIRDPADLEPAFAAAARGRAQGVVILSSPMMTRYGRRFAELAIERHLPTISLFRELAVAGCLIAYGPSQVQMFRRLGVVTGRVLKGARPADVPIERPARFDLVLNLGTAKALGLRLPPSLLARADEVIEE
jgi:putative tryptophan/tyrosine transport system substrate-binding protein